MFCDLVGSTSLAARLDAEDWRNLVGAYLDEAAAVTGLGGHVLKKLGDGLMALFGYPQAQENDGERAVRTALAIQRALAELNARNAGRGAPQLIARILAVLIDGDGRPVCSEMWPGDTADVTTLIPVIGRLRRRFDIARVCVVADRGMISAEAIAELEARRLLYILGVRERTDKLVRELGLDDPAPFVPLALSKRGKEIDYEAKTVMLAGRRYIVCRNHQEAEKDAADRASIVAALERQLAKGDKALVGNAGFRRYLKTIGGERFAINSDKIEEERKFDGVFVLRTNTDLNPLEAMLCYKRLWMVEQTFRTAKHLLSTRPIFHKLDETIRGHVFCSFLALVLKAALEDRIAALGRSGSWPEIVADLDSLTETEIEHDGKRFLVRAAPRPAASLALRAAGVALPPTIRDAAAS